jgi:HEAT repeat protein
MRLFRLVCIIALTAFALDCSQKDRPLSPSPDASDYGEQSTRATSLLKVVRDKSAGGQAKMDAVIQLGALNDPKTVKPLIDILKQDMRERSGIWAAAIPALGGLGKSEAVPVLLEALNNRDDDWLGREMAADALGDIADPVSVDALIKSSYFADTRESCIQALAGMGDVRAVEVLIGALDEAENPETIEAAGKGLLKMGDAALPALQKELQNHSKEHPNRYRREIVGQIINRFKTKDRPDTRQR